MPTKSKAQQKAAGAALSAKRGDTKVSDLQGASKDMYDSMSEDELEDFAKGERQGNPSTPTRMIDRRYRRTEALSIRRPLAHPARYVIQ